MSEYIGKQADKLGLCLTLLKEAKSPVSGEEVSSNLGVSRAAVWKYIESLREVGYEIEGVSNQGYRLVSAPDLLLPAEVKPYLPPGFEGEIHWYKSIDSTNDKAKELARSGAPTGTVVVAEMQEHGHGRRGRDWQSPAGGIWFSVILRPDASVMMASRISVFAAVIAAESIKLETGLNTLIKWPNDILVDGKKVCGILIELSAEMERVEYITVGIGVNANFDRDDLAIELRQTATTLREEAEGPVDRRRLLGAMISRLTEELPRIFTDDYLSYYESWRKLSAIFNRKVSIESQGRLYTGIALDIEEDGALIVELDVGERRRFESGDVSLILSERATS